MASPSPSQAFGYGQPGGGTLGMGALSLQQPPRSLSSQQVAARFAAAVSQISGHVTPTSSGMPSFPTSLPNSLPPQQPSPNSLLSMSARVLPNQRPALGPEMKRMVSMANALGGLEPPPRPPGPIARSVGSMAGLTNFGMSHSSRGFSTQGLMGSGMPSSTSFASNPALDLSEFPTLTNRGPQENTSNQSILSNPTAGRPAYVGMVKQPTSESNEFQIHSEDFPALPGSQNHDNNQDNLNKSLVGNSSDSPKESGRFPGDKSNQNQKRGIQTSKDGRVTNIPSGMVTDQFGMVGLLTFIRVAETDPSLVSLALGSDLTTLGLNLNSPESLYQNFGGPWAEQPCRPQDIDYHIPAEYLINQSIREKLAPVKLNRYGEDLLFFLFYMFSGDLLQLAAAAELYNREWRYHKDERVWISRAPGMVPTEKTSMYERGTYYFFDAVNWRKVAKEFHLDYERLEERPQLSQTMHYNPTQSMMA